MRKILILSRNESIALWAKRLFAFGASLAVTFCCSSDATAQTLSDYAYPDASASGEYSQFTDQVLSNFSDGSSGAEMFPLPSEPVTSASYGTMPYSTMPSPYGSAYRPMSGANCAPASCGVDCDVSWYLNYDALFLRREDDERFSLSQNNFIEEFEYEFGGRYTIGRLLDCVNGWEAVYVGPFDWQRDSSVVGAGTLQSQLIPSGGFTGADVSSFNNADQHIQSYRAQLNSFEINRRWWSWDVLSTMIGVRYVDYEEDFLLLSSNQTVGNGLYTSSADNQMIGAQVGADLFYPVGLRTNVGFRGKGGVFANFNETSTVLQNAGTNVLVSGDDSTDVAGVIEAGIFTNYQIVPSIRLTAGYEFWYLPGLVTVPGQGPRFINPGTGTNLSNDDEVLLHGGSVGLQVLF